MSVREVSTHVHDNKMMMLTHLEDTDDRHYSGGYAPVWEPNASDTTSMAKMDRRHRCPRLAASSELLSIVVGLSTRTRPRSRATQTMSDKKVGMRGI